MRSRLLRRAARYCFNRLPLRLRVLIRGWVVKRRRAPHRVVEPHPAPTSPPTVRTKDRPLGVLDIVNRLLIETRGKRLCCITYEKNTEVIDKAVAKRKVCVNPHVSHDQATTKIPSGDYFHEASGQYLVDSCHEVFDVVLISGAHHRVRALSDVENALTILADGGFVVLAGCLPKDRLTQLPRSEFDAAKVQAKSANRAFSNAWVGDVWKAAVELLQTKRDLRIFTLNVAWGAMVISRGEPEPVRSLGDPTYEEFANNLGFYLNLKDMSYLDEFVLARRGQRVPKFYTESPLKDLAIFAKNRHLDGEVTAHVYRDAVLLPTVQSRNAEGFEFFRGGVVDSNGQFVAGLLRRHGARFTGVSVLEAYEFDPREVATIAETVVFAGCLNAHFGHMLVDGMTRFWWFVQHPEYNGKIALLWLRKVQPAEAYFQIFDWLGIARERIIVVTEPTRFSQVIVPDQTSYSLEGYYDHYLDPFEAVRASIEPAQYDKVYFTRRLLPSPDTINEEYFEDHFARQGFEVIAPEKLSLEKQISIVAGAREIACVSGTLALWSLFARDDVKLTVLQRTPVLMSPVALQARNIDVTYIDVFMNFLPTDHPNGTFLLMPTPQWRRYLADNNIELSREVELRDYAFDYLSLWARNFQRVPSLKWIKDANMLDLLCLLNKYVLGKELSRAPYEMMFKSK